MVYVETELEGAESYAHYEALGCLKLLKIIDNLDFDSYSIDLRDRLIALMPLHHPSPSYSVINIQNSQRKVVGTIVNSFLNLTDEIIYPGGTSEIPNAYKTYINFSMAMGRTNPGYFDSFYYPFLKEGANASMFLVNNEHRLGNFELQYAETNCGAEVYYKPWSQPCLEAAKPILGVAHLTSAFPSVCAGTIESFRELNITIPIISEFCAETIFTNKTVFPEFMRVMKNYGFNIRILLNLASIFGWENIIVIYQNTTTGVDLYNYFLEAAADFRMTILNKPEHRVVKFGYYKTDFEEYKEMFEAIRDTKGRIVMLLVDPPSVFFLIEALYDVGLRRGDVVLMCYLRILFAIGTETDPVARLKLEALLYGSLSVFQAEWVGDYGQGILP